MTTHTPTPWRVSSFEQAAGGVGRVIIGADSYSVAHVMDRTPAENEVDAAFIVKAVNSHDALVKALQTAIRVADEAREVWDKAPAGMKAGKLLIALSDPSLHYRADISEIHAVLASIKERA